MEVIATFCLDKISPNTLIIISIAVTFLISNGKDEGELNVIGNLLVAIGGLVLLIAAQEQFLKSK